MTQIKDKAGRVEYHTNNYVSQLKMHNMICDEIFVKEQFDKQFKQKPAHTLKEDGTYIEGYEYTILPVRPE